MPSGGARKGSGRRKLPKQKKRIMVSVKVSPAAADKWREMAADHDLSQGKLVEKFLGFDPTPGKEEDEEGESVVRGVRFGKDAR